MQKHNSSCKANNVTKVSNTVNLRENDFETVVKGVQKLQFDDQNTAMNDQYSCTECSFRGLNSTQTKDHLRYEHDIKSEDKVPERLSDMLSMRGICINDHRLRRAGGGGKCGVNCVSLFTTGSEDMAGEIRNNANEHIVSNWETYRNSYEFPYTERVGNRSEDEIEFLTFLREDEGASSMWMTHICMQAVATMLNLNIKILTTGISPSSYLRCTRCKPTAVFNSEEEVIQHMEGVHHRKETREEMEGRKQRARWSDIQPDSKVMNKTAINKAEELILLHEDDTHYNIIVHKSHNAFRRENTIKEQIKNHEETLFGEFIFKDSKNQQISQRPQY